jgi:hypothetical protein
LLSNTLFVTLDFHLNFYHYSIMTTYIQAAWNYYENKSNGEIFTQDELSQWNKSKKDAK